MAKRLSAKYDAGRKRVTGRKDAEAAWVTMRLDGVAPENPEARRLRADLAGRVMGVLIARGMNFTGEGNSRAWPSLVADMSVRFADALVAKLGEPVEGTWEKSEPGELRGRSRGEAKKKISRPRKKGL